jgi:hypothetical protein
MARPTKTGVDYFPHYCHHGGTIFVLERKYGIQGFGAWFKLLEILGQSEGHYINATIKTKWLKMQAETYFDENKLIEYLDLLADLEAIDKDLWIKSKIIWCQNFVDGIREVYLRRGKKIPQKPNGLYPISEKEVSDTETIPDDDNRVGNENDNDDLKEASDTETIPDDDNRVGNENDNDDLKEVSDTETLVSDAESTQTKLNNTKLNKDSISHKKGINNLVWLNIISKVENKKLQEKLRNYADKISVINSNDAERLKVIIETYSDSEINYAINQAISRGKYKIGYIEAILMDKQNKKDASSKDIGIPVDYDKQFTESVKKRTTSVNMDEPVEQYREGKNV